MVKYIQIFFFQFAITNLSAQFIDSVKILPAIIHEADSVTFIDFITSPGIFTEVKDSIQKNGDLDSIKCYYYQTGFPTVESGSDTFKLGTFLPGTYSVLFSAFNCIQGQPCMEYHTTVYFTVLGPNSIYDIEDNRRVSLYPNPATNQLLISASDLQPQTITIYNLNGQQLINLPFAHEVDISTLPPGVYFVEVTGVQGTEVRKLVKM